MTGGLEQSENRDRAIRLAVVTSLFSKFGTVILRLISIPVAIRVLGMEEFGVYATIMVIVSMIDALHVGIGPALTREISRAVAEGNREKERGVFATALLLSAGLTLLVATIAFLLVLFVSIESLFGDKYAPFSESIQRACSLAIVIVAVQMICIVCEKARDGFLETRFNNAWGAAGNILGAVSLLIGIWFFPTIEFLVLAINGSVVLAKVGNITHLLAFQRRYLWPRFSAFRRILVKPLLGDGARFTVTYGLSALVEYNAIAYLVGRLSGPAAAGAYAVMVTVHFSLTGVVQMVTVPTWPALVDAHARGDLGWIRRTARRLRLLGPAFALVAALGLALLGTWALPIWAGEEFSISQPAIVAFGAYFFLHIWRHVNQTLAIGLGKIGASVGVIVIEAALVLGLAILASTAGSGLAGVYLAIGAGLLGVSAWLFPAIYGREMRQLERNAERTGEEEAAAGAGSAVAV